MLSSCFFLVVIGFICKKNFRKTFQRLLGRIPRRISINIFNNSSFNTFPGFSQNLPENVSIFFAKMIDLCLLTQKNQTLYGVIGRNTALWQNLCAGLGRFDRRSSSAHASRLRSAAGSINSDRHILELRCAERCANDAFLTSFRATLILFLLFQCPSQKAYLSRRRNALGPCNHACPIVGALCCRHVKQTLLHICAWLYQAVPEPSLCTPVLPLHWNCSMVGNSTCPVSDASISKRRGPICSLVCRQNCFRPMIQSWLKSPLLFCTPRRHSEGYDFGHCQFQSESVCRAKYWILTSRFHPALERQRKNNSKRCININRNRKFLIEI